MVRGVVLNEEHLLSAITLCQAIEEGGVAPAFKNVSTPIVESGAVQIDGSEDLLRVSLPRRRDEWLMTPPCPSLIEGRILAETGFIAEEQSRAAISGFFLSEGRYNDASDPARRDPLLRVCGAGAAPKSPSL